MTRVPVAETRAVAKALDGEHDTVEDAADAAIRAIDEVRDKAGVWGGFVFTSTRVGEVPVVVGRGPWPSKAAAKKDMLALAAAGPDASWARIIRMRRETDGYRQG